MRAFRTETVLSQNGVLLLKGLPFRAGEKVEVIILRPRRKRPAGARYPLRAKPIRYLAPFESVAENEWNVLQ